MIVLDGSGAPLGRLASEVVNLLKRGETVYVVNAEKIIISGSMRDIFERWKRRIDLRSLGNPRKHTPKYPRTVEGIVKWAIKGMIPRRSKRGREMLKRVKVFVGVPHSLKVNLNLNFNRPSRYVYLEELVRKLGGRV